MDTSDVMNLLIILVLIFLSGFFSSAETAFSTLNRVRIRALEEEGNKKAAKVNKILESYSKMLSAILIGNNIVNLSASSLTTTFTISVCGNAYVGLATGILTFIVLVGGEIIPKTWASLNAEKLSLTYSSIIYALMKIMTPFIFIVDIIANGIMHLFHMNADKRNDTITENELKTYVDVSHEDGEIESDERKMIYNIFDFSDTCVKDIMIPRTNMVTVNADDSVDDLIRVFQESMYTRIPVYQEEKDSMIGFVNIKDLFIARISGNRDITLKSLVREAYYTYEYKKNADLLIEMREKSMNVAFVLNEYGSTVGMITLEDLLEELVGEIRDEYDEDEEELIQPVGDRSYLIEGSMNLSDINDSLGTNLNSEEYDSIGGIIIGQLDRLPEDGESVSLKDGTTLQVKGIDQNRILSVLLTLPKQPVDENTDGEN